MAQIELKTLSLEEQKQLRAEATDKIDKVCGNCQLILENRKKLNNKGAYNYCVRECSIGKELQVIGQKLLQARGFDEALEELEESEELED